MAKEMMSFRVDADLREALVVEAGAERRSVGNMLELILRERYSGGAMKEALVRIAGTPTKSSPEESKDMAREAMAALHPESVPPVVHDVPMRPHMRKDRPALQCDELVPGGGTCSVCGKVVV